MESDRDFKEVGCCRVAAGLLDAAAEAGRCNCCDAIAAQVLEQSIEPSLSSENVVIAGGGMRLQNKHRTKTPPFLIVMQASIPATSLRRPLKDPASPTSQLSSAPVGTQRMTHT